MKKIVINLLILLLFSAKAYCNPPSTIDTNKEYVVDTNYFSEKTEEDREYVKNLKQAGDYLDKFEFDKSIEYSENALKFKPDDYLARALISLDDYEIAEELNINNKEERQKKLDLYDDMERIADEGIKSAPNQGECYFLRGLAKARRATTKGVLASLFSAKSIEKDWLKSIALKSHSKTSYPSEHLLAYCYLSLGIYYRLCPSFFLLKLIFGISGDINKSVYYCKKAYQLDPNRIELVKEYGVSLITRGLNNNNQKDIDKGEEFLKKIENLPIIQKTDYLDKIQSKILLNNIKLCPGYSRDQEQDISEETYKKLYEQTKTNK